MDVNHVIDKDRATKLQEDFLIKSPASESGFFKNLGALIVIATRFLAESYQILRGCKTNHPGLPDIFDLNITSFEYNVVVMFLVRFWE